MIKDEWGSTGRLQMRFDEISKRITQLSQVRSDWSIKNRYLEKIHISRTENTNIQKIAAYK